MADARNGRFPQDIVGHPFHRHILIGSDAGTVGTAEARPIACFGHVANQQQDAEDEW